MPDKSNKDELKIGYARISTADQNLDMQIEALKRAGVPESLIFTDTMSGAKKKRPGLSEAMKYAQSEGAALLVWKLDRLGRSLVGILETVQLLSDREIRLVSLTEGLDLATPMGRMVLHIMASLAEYERELISERTMAGLAQAKRDGKAHGRPIAMTDARCELAKEMLMSGQRVTQDILPALQALDGPEVKRSALYQWVKDHRAIEKKEDSTDDR